MALGLPSEARILRPQVREGEGKKRIEAALLSIVTDCVYDDSRFYAAFADVLQLASKRPAQFASSESRRGQ